MPVSGPPGFQPMRRLISRPGPKAVQAANQASVMKSERRIAVNARRLDFAGPAGQNPFMADEHSRRIDKLEANQAHLEHQVEQLNSVVIEQGKLLERLKKEVQRQSSAMQTLELDRIKANNPRPPHYQ